MNDKIRIAIIALPCRTGGGLVGTKNILRAWSEINQDDSFLVIAPPNCGYENIALNSQFQLYIYKGSHAPWARYWFEEKVMPKIVNDFSADVILGIGNIGLTKTKTPQALFIRQACLFYPQTHFSDISFRSRLRLAALKHQVKKSLPDTNILLVQTPIVRKRLADEFEFAEDKIHVIRFAKPDEIDDGQKIDCPSVISESPESFFFFALTPYYPHRNPGDLLPLCKKYKKQIRARGVKFITTVNKSDHPKAGKYIQSIKKLGLEDIIINVGFLSRSDVCSFMNFSHCLWMPTLVETLGIPYIEAMNCDLPILTPNVDFAHYVCGDAAAYYEPWNIDSLFNKIILIRDNQQFRENLIAQANIERQDETKFARNWREVANDIQIRLKEIAVQK